MYTGEGLVPEELDDYDIDHIVPRSKGGPDAVVNYVLTRRSTNDDKSDRTPYEWLSATEGWDAYVNRVRERIGSLRNKKVQLLISPNSQELIQKYTALAETAWISKLAQAIVSLHFGWNQGLDEGTRRVTVVSGGLTGRIRRKYRLNSILNPNAIDEEDAEKKNRSDNRHHALDAMVISFIPNWARNAKKETFFRFPEGVHRETFAQRIAEVIPKNICFERPVLAETIYGARSVGSGKVIVQRVELRALAYKPLTPGKSQYDLNYAKKQATSVRDTWIRRELAAFIESKPDEAAWLRFCESFRLRRKKGVEGSLVKFVTVDVGDATEYADLSKDGTGAYRKALKGHKGQIVYRDENRRLRVRPIYAFESVAKVKEELLKNCPNAAVQGFYRSGVLVELTSAISHSTTPLAPGIYKLNTIFADGRAKVTDAAGKQSLPISLEKFLTAGLRKVE